MQLILIPNDFQWSLHHEDQNHHYSHIDYQLTWSIIHLSFFSCPECIPGQSFIAFHFCRRHATTTPRDRLSKSKADNKRHVGLPPIPTEEEAMSPENDPDHGGSPDFIICIIDDVIVLWVHFGARVGQNNSSWVSGQGLCSIKKPRLTGIEIPIVNLTRSDDVSGLYSNSYNNNTVNRGPGATCLRVTNTLHCIACSLFTTNS